MFAISDISGFCYFKRSVNIWNIVNENKLFHKAVVFGFSFCFVLFCIFTAYFPEQVIARVPHAHIQLQGVPYQLKCLQ